VCRSPRSPRSHTETGLYVLTQIEYAFADVEPPTRDSTIVARVTLDVLAIALPPSTLPTAGAGAASAGAAASASHVAAAGAAAGTSQSNDSGDDGRVIAKGATTSALPHASQLTWQLPRLARRIATQIKVDVCPGDVECLVLHTRFEEGLRCGWRVGDGVQASYWVPPQSDTPANLQGTVPDHDALAVGVVATRVQDETGVHVLKPFAGVVTAVTATYHNVWESIQVRKKLGVVVGCRCPGIISRRRSDPVCGHAYTFNGLCSCGCRVIHAFTGGMA